MNDVVEFLTSQELIVVYIVVGIVCLLGFAVHLIDKSYYKRRRKQNTKELFKLVDQIEEKLEETKNQEKEVKNVVEEVKNSEPMTVLYVENQEEKINSKMSSSPVAAKNVENQIINTIPKQEVIMSLPKNIPSINYQKNIETYENKQNVASTVEQLEVQEEKQPVENLVLDSMKEDIIKENKLSNTTKLARVEELTYTDIEPKKEEAQAELKRLTEELQKAEEQTRKINITSLEEEQEENAIISLEELIKKSQEKHYDKTVELYEEDDENKPISIEELENLQKQMNGLTIESESVEEPIEELLEEPEIIEPYQEKMVFDEFNNVKIEQPHLAPYSDNRNFKNSPVISPVYGIEQKTSVKENELALENTANYEKLDEEIKKTNEFLMTLRELQKKLD